VLDRVWDTEELFVFTDYKTHSKRSVTSHVIYSRCVWSRGQTVFDTGHTGVVKDSARRFGFLPFCWFYKYVQLRLINCQVCFGTNMRVIVFRRRRARNFCITWADSRFSRPARLILVTTIDVLIQRQFMELFTAHIARISSNSLVYEMSQNFVTRAVFGDLKNSWWSLF
jgi:hypothetical protein